MLEKCVKFYITLIAIKLPDVYNKRDKELLTPATEKYHFMLIACSILLKFGLENSFCRVSY